MKELGLEPIVITRSWENKFGNSKDYISRTKTQSIISEKNKFGTLIKTPYSPNFPNRLLLNYGPHRYSFLRKLISAFYEILQFFLIIGPKKNIYLEAHTFLKNNKVDLIIASAEPFVLFSYASKLSSIFSTPWIADYRDPWVQDKKRGDNFIRRRWDSYLEKKFLENAHSIITVSDFFKKEILKSKLNKSIHVISNGYIEEFFNSPQQFTNNEKLVLCYLGTVYDWHPVKSIFDVLEKLITINSLEIELHFYGTNKEEKLKKWLKKYSFILGKNIKFFPKINAKELEKKLRNVNIFLLFNDYNNVGTKIYDYLALRRNIILCYINDLEAKRLKSEHYNIKLNELTDVSKQSELIQKTNSGCSIVDSEHLYDYLIECNNEFKSLGYITSKVKNIEKFSRKTATQNLFNIINQII